MKSKLIVKHFGPIEIADLDLKSVNVFIGPQASGKSTLAKLYTICNSPRLYHNFDDKKNSFFSITKNKEDLELFKEPRLFSIEELQPLIINTIPTITINFFIIFLSFHLVESAQVDLWS